MPKTKEESDDTSKDKSKDESKDKSKDESKKKKGEPDYTPSEDTMFAIGGWAYYRSYR
jgi:hypothetical protein